MARKRTNNKLNPHMASMLGFEPGSHWWAASPPQMHHPCSPCHTVSLPSSCSLSVLLCTQPSTLINIGEYAKVSPVSSVTVSGSMPLHSLLTSHLSEIYSDARMALLGHLRIYRFSVEVTL